METDTTINFASSAFPCYKIRNICMIVSIEFNKYLFYKLVFRKNPKQLFLTLLSNQNTFRRSDATRTG